MEVLTTHAACMRIRTEYIEMPDLKLTLSQVRRLCGLRPEVCDAAVRSLVVSGFLWETADGSFRRRGSDWYPTGVGRESDRCQTGVRLVSDTYASRLAARRDLVGD